jgi:hypothetical protein
MPMTRQHAGDGGAIPRLAQSRVSWLPALCLILLVGCGPAPDPPLEAGHGELGSFLTAAVSQATGSRASTNPLAPLQGAWSSRVLTPRNISMRYVLPKGWQALQVSTGITNLATIRDWLTASLGTAISLGANGERGIAWQSVPPNFSIWLSQSNDTCLLQISGVQPGHAP